MSPVIQGNQKPPKICFKDLEQYFFLQTIFQGPIYKYLGEFCQLLFQPQCLDVAVCQLLGARFY